MILPIKSWFSLNQASNWIRLMGKFFQGNHLKTRRRASCYEQPGNSTRKLSTINQAFIPTTANGYRPGDRISTGLVESAENHVPLSTLHSGNNCPGVRMASIYSCRCEPMYSTANWNKPFESSIPALGRRVMKNSKRLLILPRFYLLPYSD